MNVDFAGCANRGSDTDLLPLIKWVGNKTPD